MRAIGSTILHRGITNNRNNTEPLCQGELIACMYADRLFLVLMLFNIRTVAVSTGPEKEVHIDTVNRAIKSDTSTRYIIVNAEGTTQKSYLITFVGFESFTLKQLGMSVYTGNDCHY